ncbi:MAG TPA: NIPSNAP family protein [Stellaceae bacterium]|nr:NIPSNAP family protein [Stellaceae bacterium]
MIVEQRTYLVKLGKTPEYLRAVETLGLPVMRECLGGLIGYFVTDVGPLNEVVHLWAYESLEDRARRRAACAAHPGWAPFIDVVRPLLEHQASRVMTVAPFTPITLDGIRALNRGQ